MTDKTYDCATSTLTIQHGDQFSPTVVELKKVEYQVFIECNDRCEFYEDGPRTTHTRYEDVNLAIQESERLRDRSHAAWIEIVK